MKEETEKKGKSSLSEGCIARDHTPETYNLCICVFLCTYAYKNTFLCTYMCIGEGFQPIFARDKPDKLHLSGVEQSDLLLYFPNSA